MRLAMRLAMRRAGCVLILALIALLTAGGARASFGPVEIRDVGGATEAVLTHPIRDATVDSSGQLINNTSFLRAQSKLFETQGWNYGSAMTMWNPPVGP